MTKVRRRYFFLPLLVLLIFCGFSVFRFVLPPLSPPAPTTPPPNWFTDWLNTPMCQPPCWQGVIPGETTITDAAEILQSVSWIKITSEPGKLLPSNEIFSLEWEFSSPSEGWGAVYSLENGIVRNLFFDADLSTSLKDVISRYGEPSDVFVSSCDNGKCITKLIYMSKGMIVDLFLDWERDTDGDVTVSEDSEITGIEFFVPGEKGFLSAYPQYSQSFPRWFSPWRGYSKYSYRK